MHPLQGLLGVSRNSKDERTIESISDELLEIVAGDDNVCGQLDHGQALIKITRYAMANDEFRNALHTLSSHVLKVFPIKPDGETNPSKSE